MFDMIFSKSKGKGGIFLAGYNMASEEERRQYDKPRICKYMGRQIQLIAIFFVLGAIIDCFIPEKGYLVILILFAIWLIHHALIRYKKFDEMFKMK